MFQVLGFPTDYMQNWHLAAWIGIIIMMYCFVIIFLARVKTAQTPIQKSLYRSFSWFLFFYGITIIAIMFSIWSPSNFNMWQVIANFIGLVSLLPIVLSFEKNLVPKTHFFFTIIGIILCGTNGILVLMFFFFNLSPDLSLRIAQIGAATVLLIIIAMFFVLVRQTAGEIRRRSIATLFGIALTGIGAIFNGKDILVLGIPLYVAPILFGLGIILMSISQLNRTKSI